MFADFTCSSLSARLQIDSEEVEGGRKFVVLGSTGNVYDVVISKLLSCSCPDHAKGNHCKHLIFVLMKVCKINVRDPVLYQAALLSSEVESTLRCVRMCAHVTRFVLVLVGLESAFLIDFE